MQYTFIVIYCKCNNNNKNTANKALLKRIYIASIFLLFSKHGCNDSLVYVVINQQGKKRTRKNQTRFSPMGSKSRSDIATCNVPIMFAPPLKFKNFHVNKNDTTYILPFG